MSYQMLSKYTLTRNQMYIILVNAAGGDVSQSWDPLVYYNCENWLRRDHILPNAIKIYFPTLLYQMYATLANAWGWGSVSQNWHPLRSTVIARSV